MGLSRDDYTKFSGEYETLKIFKADPFASIDQEGVGKMIIMGSSWAARLGRIWKSVSAASMAAIQPRSSFVIGWV